MGFPATRKPCDIALQGGTLLVFVFGITPPPHRPDAAVKAELIPTRPSASACCQWLAPRRRGLRLVARAMAPVDAARQVKAIVDRVDVA